MAQQIWPRWAARIAIWVLPHESKYAKDYKGPEPF
jgi:hypothetical protein